MRIGNFFENTRLLFVTIVRFLYRWALEYTSIKFDKREMGMSDETTVDWSMYMRNVCVDYLLSKPKQSIGGEKMVVEIDESQFSKRKNNVGRVFPPQWIFGGVCRESRECFLVAVPDRSAKTLLKCIKEYIAPGSIVISDCWRGYKTKELDEAGYEHFKVNHSYNFLHPDDPEVHTQCVERMRGSAKWRNKKQRGTKREFLDTYLAEFMVRKGWKGDDPFDSLLEMIAKMWPPVKNL
jgi:transposase-like protein